MMFPYLPQLLQLQGCIKEIEKQPPSGVLSKKCSEKMQQIYRRTPMPKCDFNKVDLQVPKNYLEPKSAPLSKRQKRLKSLIFESTC